MVTMDSQIRKDIRDMLDRIIMAGGRRKKSSTRTGQGLRAYGLRAGKKRKTTKTVTRKVTRRVARPKLVSRTMCGSSGTRKRKTSTRSGRARAAVNPWVKHVRQYARAHGITYSE